MTRTHLRNLKSASSAPIRPHISRTYYAINNNPAPIAVKVNHIRNPTPKRDNKFPAPINNGRSPPNHPCGGRPDTKKAGPGKSSRARLVRLLQLDSNQQPFD